MPAPEPPSESEPGTLRHDYPGKGAAAGRQRGGVRALTARTRNCGLWQTNWPVGTSGMNSGRICGASTGKAWTPKRGRRSKCEHVSHLRTLPEVAAQQNVTPRTVQKDALFAAAVDAVERNVPGAKETILAGESGLPKAEVARASNEAARRAAGGERAQSAWGGRYASMRPSRHLGQKPGLTCVTAHSGQAILSGNRARWSRSMRRSSLAAWRIQATPCGTPWSWSLTSTSRVAAATRAAAVGAPCARAGRPVPQPPRPACAVRLSAPL